MKSPATTRRVIDTLSEQHPNADTELHYRTPFELLVATILSAQSTDARVNLVTPALFKRYPNAAALAKRSSGRRPERKLCRDGQQSGHWQYARSKRTAPPREARRSMLGVLLTVLP